MDKHVAVSSDRDGLKVISRIEKEIVNNILSLNPQEIIFSGGFIPPQTRPESVRMAEYAKEVRGFDGEILLDTESLDTTLQVWNSYVNFILGQDVRNVFWHAPDLQIPRIQGIVKYFTKNDFTSHFVSVPSPLPVMLTDPEKSFYSFFQEELKKVEEREKAMAESGLVSGDLEGCQRFFLEEHGLYNTPEAAYRVARLPRK